MESWGPPLSFQDPERPLRLASRWTRGSPGPPDPPQPPAVPGSDPNPSASRQAGCQAGASTREPAARGAVPSHSQTGWAHSCWGATLPIPPGPHTQCPLSAPDTLSCRCLQPITPATPPLPRWGPKHPSGSPAPKGSVPGTWESSRGHSREVLQVTLPSDTRALEPRLINQLMD